MTTEIDDEIDVVMCPTWVRSLGWRLGSETRDRLGTGTHFFANRNATVNDTRVNIHDTAHDTHVPRTGTHRTHDMQPCHALLDLTSPSPITPCVRRASLS